MDPTPPETWESLPPELATPDPETPPPVDLWSVVGDIQPWATVLLVLSWGCVFAALAIRGAIGDRMELLAWGASATGLGRLDSAWRLLGSTFVHAGGAHAFFNAVSMLVLGPAVERIFTRWGFCVLFGFGGAAASLASLAWRAWRYGSETSLSVGASGAIFALGGALLVGAYRLRHKLGTGRARALAAALLFLVGQGLVAGVTRNGTDNVAHAAGLAAGLVLGGCTPMNVRLGGKPQGLVIRVLGALAALALGLSLTLVVRSGLAPVD